MPSSVPWEHNEILRVYTRYNHFNVEQATISNGVALKYVDKFSDTPISFTRWSLIPVPLSLT